MGGLRDAALRSIPGKSDALAQTPLALGETTEFHGHEVEICIPLMAIGSMAIPLMAEAQPEVDFQRANVAYESGNFAGALEQYEAILATHRHFESEFNAGNAAFKLNRLGTARLHYERAAFVPFGRTSEGQSRLAGIQHCDPHARTEPALKSGWHPGGAHSGWCGRCGR